MPDSNIEDNRNIKEAEQSWDSGIAFSSYNNTYKLVRALLSEADRIDSNLESIYDQHHVDTATGRDLDKIGDLVNISRNTNESDKRFRSRVKGKFRSATTGTTFDQFTEFTASVLNTSVENVDFLTNYNIRPGIVTVSAQQSVYDAINLTATDVKQILGDGVPAGHEVRVLTGGTFRLKADGDTDDPDKGLTSDAISTGGTVAEDLV